MAVALVVFAASVLFLLLFVVIFNLFGNGKEHFIVQFLADFAQECDSQLFVCFFVDIVVAFEQVVLVFACIVIVIAGSGCRGLEGFIINQQRFKKASLGIS